MSITGGINTLIDNLEQVQEDATVIKNKGVVKSIQEGVHNGGMVTVNRVANSVTDVLLAPISAVDSSKAVICSPVREISGGSYRTTIFPVVKNDGIYLRHINAAGDTGTYSEEFDSFYWKVIEFY